MSVIYFTDEDIGCLYRSMSRIVCRADFYMNIDDEKHVQFLGRVGLCNRLAYNYNYLEENSKEILLTLPTMETQKETVLPLKKLIERLELLEYNCITNSGRCFLDRKDHSMLRILIHRLRIRYIEVLEKR